MLAKTLKQAIRKAILRAGSQKELAGNTGVPQSKISKYISERFEIENITAGTVDRLFPEMTIYFFRDELPAGARSIIRGRVDASRGGTVVNGDNHGDITLGAKPAELVSASELSDLVMDCPDVSAETKIKIMKLLKEDRK